MIIPNIAAPVQRTKTPVPDAHEGVRGSAVTPSGYTQWECGDTLSCAYWSSGAFKTTFNFGCVRSDGHCHR